MGCFQLQENNIRPSSLRLLKLFEGQEAFKSLPDLYTVDCHSQFDPFLKIRKYKLIHSFILDLFIVSVCLSVSLLIVTVFPCNFNYFFNIFTKIMFLLTPCAQYLRICDRRVIRRQASLLTPDVLTKTEVSYGNSKKSRRIA